MGRPASLSMPPSRVVLGEGGGFDEGVDGFSGDVVRSRVDWALKSV